jgi:hypothetical protein
MGAVSNRQIYDLLLEISETVEHINASADEILVNMRILNQEMAAGSRRLAEARAVLAQRRGVLQ